MSHSSHSFIAEKLAEVVQDRQRRQDMMVNSLTIFGLLFLSLFSVLNYINQSYFLANLLLGFVIWGSANIFLLRKHRTAGLISLNFILYSLSWLLIWTGGREDTGLLWVYPIIAISIFIIPFRVGIRLIPLFLLSISAVFVFDSYMDVMPTNYSPAVEVRFVLTLAALCGMCLILVNFQTKSDEYLMQMHKEDIQSLAYLDSLTRIANRSAFLSVLYHSTVNNKAKRSALVYIDLDNFKPINDIYGHDKGDTVLAEFGQKLKSTCLEAYPQLGKYDIARIGGDEFAVYISSVDSDQQTIQLVESIIDLFKLDQMSTLEDIEHNLSASIGINFYNSSLLEPAQALRIADDAMYQAKHAGKNDYVVV
ncbi:GGDEF domain-containing protein [Vibrio sp. SCSIO 43136]|uniref:GGDEF domain-containing protein n=1 Tax=Vibrio sp. SCSIO 43136 TaxID=2819101 RepID=UPI002074BB53|nr:GGDEF domain-containing protein [Vibrio sp. SCSIO 43136]USD67942.1 GGDEF domain-containing protein [Vibrio sp. SCSIO 43136]